MPTAPDCCCARTRASAGQAQWPCTQRGFLRPPALARQMTAASASPRPTRATAAGTTSFFAVPPMVGATVRAPSSWSAVTVRVPARRHLHLRDRRERAAASGERRAVVMLIGGDREWPAVEADVRRLGVDVCRSRGAERHRARTPGWFRSGRRRSRCPPAHARRRCRAPERMGELKTPETPEAPSTPATTNAAMPMMRGTSHRRPTGPLTSGGCQCGGTHGGLRTAGRGWGHRPSMTAIRRRRASAKGLGVPGLAGVGAGIERRGRGLAVGRGKRRRRRTRAWRRRRRAR